MKPLILVVGPCAYESTEQMEQVFRDVQKSEQTISENDVPVVISLVRASMYKPRTSPGCFEGHGFTGAKELKAVLPKYSSHEQDYYYPPFITTEIPNGEELKKLYSLGYKNFWIGSRTATNPFSVQDIADALKEIVQRHGKNGLSIGIKNPMNDDVALWHGAYQRILDAGVQPYLIFRGTSNRYEKTFRNSPSWDVAFRMRGLIDDSVVILLDPSHIAGQWNYILNLSIAGLGSGLFNGLMVEFHPHPADAMSDAKQQLPTDYLPAFCIKVGEAWKKMQNAEKANIEPVLKVPRQSIDELDEKFFKAFEQYIKARRTCTDYIGRQKREFGLPVFDFNRFSEILNKRIGVLDEDVRNLAGEIFQAIHADSANRQIVL